MIESAELKAMRDWIVNEWTEKIAAILESMADERPGIERGDEVRQISDADSSVLLWRQKFSLSEDTLLWVNCPLSTAKAIGSRTLVASGIDAVTDEDAMSTFLEVLNQSLSALGQSLGNHLGCEAAATDGSQVNEAPGGIEWTPIRLVFASGSLDELLLACSHALLEQTPVEPNAAEQRIAESGTAGSPNPPALSSPVSSKTFDLLLDVALPVSVSFGRTYLPVKEVLKLTTGSIVELDRGVSEPVDVIVNNCVIARGEVVVVEGNYGVRIHQIASRYDRLRTGHASAQSKHAAPVE